MYLFIFFIYLTYSTEIITHNINVGIILDTTPSYLIMSEMLFRSFNLAFSNHTYQSNNHHFIFINKNITNDVACEVAANYVFSKELHLLFLYTNPLCRQIIYDMNPDVKVLLLIPDIYTKLQCIKYSVHAGIFIHEIHMLLSQLKGDVVILSYENGLLEYYDDLFLPSNNYNFKSVKYCGSIEYTSIDDVINKIKQMLPNGGSIISSLIGKDTNDLLNRIKTENMNEIVLYSLDDSVNSVYTSNANAVNHYLFVNYVEDLESSEFTELYQSKYGDTDKISISIYMAFYMIKHWLDSIDKLVFYDGMIIKMEYRSNIITPETVLYFHENNFFYSDYYMFKVNNLNNLEMVQKFNVYSDLDDRSFSPIISNITHQELCDIKVLDVKYVAFLYNEYMIEDVDGIVSSLDIIASELTHFYKSENIYTLRIIKKIIPDSVEELEQMLYNFSSIYRLDTVFAGLESESLYQIIPTLETLNILLYNVEETEGNICNSHVIFLNSIIYPQFHFFVSVDYNRVPKTLDHKTLYVIYSEGRYGDYMSEMIKNSEYMVTYVVKYHQLKQDLSNIDEVVNILTSEARIHIILHGSQGKCSYEFFNKYHGNPQMKLFISFSHSTPFKYFAFKININNFYFISLNSNNDVNESDVPIEYYIKFNSKYTIDYRIGKNSVKMIIDAIKRCTSYYSNEYKNCFTVKDVETNGTAIGSNFYTMGYTSLYTIDSNNNNNIITVVTSPFVQNTYGYNYNFTSKTIEVCDALQSKTSTIPMAYVHIIFPYQTENALYFYYSIFNLIQDMFIMGVDEVLPKLFYYTCKVDDFSCMKDIFDNVNNIQSEVSYILLPLTDEFMHRLKDRIVSSKSFVINYNYYSESLCTTNYINMGDSLEQTMAGLNNITLSLTELYERSGINLCVIGYNDIYSKNLLKHLKGNVLYIRFNIIFYYADNDILTVTIPKIVIDCKGSFLISTLSADTNAEISPLIPDVTLIIVRNDEADVLAHLDELNDVYIVSTYHNNLTVQSNKKLHKSFEDYGRQFDIFNRTFTYAVNNSFLIHTYILDLYTALQFIRNKNELLMDSPKDDVIFTRCQNIASHVYVIQIRNKEFILAHRTNSTLILPLFYTRYGNKGDMVHPFDVKNVNRELINDDIYTCEKGELVKTKVYYLLYLYNNDNLHDFVTLQGYISSSYNLSIAYNITMRILMFYYDSPSKLNEYKTLLDEYMNNFTISSIAGCYYEECISFFRSYLADKDVPFLYPYQTIGESCSTNIIFGGSIASQEIMSLFYHLQRWDMPMCFIVDESEYSLTYMKMAIKHLSYYNITQLIYNISSSDASVMTIFHLFERIRRDIPNGGLIVLLIDNDDLIKEVIRLGYKYLLNSEVVHYYMLINNSPEFTYLQLRNEIKHNRMFYIENFNPRSESILNIRYIHFLQSYFGMEMLYDDNSATLYALTQILYSNYVSENTISFNMIKTESLVRDYETILGAVSLTYDLYVSVKVMLRFYNKEGTKLIVLNDDAVTYYPHPFSIVYNDNFYYCNENGEKEEYPFTVRIAFVHPFTGKYKDLYSSAAYAFTLSSDFFTHFMMYDIKYIISFYDCGDDMEKLKSIMEELVNKNVAAIFGGYPSLKAREIISKEVENKDTLFIYIYDTTYQECYNKNFIVLGMPLHQKLVAIGEFIDISKIMNTNLIVDKEDILEGWYIYEVFNYIMNIHHVDYADIYEIFDYQYRVIFDLIRARNSKCALVVYLDRENSYKFYSELYKYSQLYSDFEYEVFDINMDYYTALQYPIEYIMNNHFVCNYHPDYHLPYYSFWTEDTVFSYIKLSNVSSIAYTAAYMTEFYYTLSHTEIDIDATILQYEAPEGSIILDHSNYISRYVRIGKFYNNSNKISVRLAYTSSNIIEANPYYHYHHTVFYQLICDVYHGANLGEMVLLVFVNDGSEYTRQIYRGMTYVINKYNGVLNGINVEFTEIPLNEVLLEYYSSLNDEVMFFGCSSKECNIYMEPFLRKNNRTLFSFNDDPGTCSTHIFSTVKNKANVVTTILNHFYAKNIRQVLLLAEDINNIYTNLYRSYSKILGFRSVIIVDPTINSVRNFLDGIFDSDIVVFNTIPYLSPSVFNYISSKSKLETFSFCTLDLYRYYGNTSYDAKNVYSIDSYFDGLSELDFMDFESGFKYIYNRIPTYFNYIGYNAVELYYKVVEELGSFDLLNNLDRIINKMYMVGLHEQYINKYLASTNNLYIVTVDDNNELKYVKAYSGELESYMHPYPWYLDAYSGLECIVDYENKITSTKKMQYNIVGLIFSINDDELISYTRPVVLTIINAINYYIVNGIYIYIYFLCIEKLYTFIVTYDCYSNADFIRAFSSLLTRQRLKVIIGGMSKYESDLVKKYVDGTEIMFFSIYPCLRCYVSKNLIFSSTPLQAIYPAVEYITNNDYNQRIVFVYSQMSVLLINRVKVELDYINIDYYLVDEENYEEYIDNFIENYVRKESLNIICLLYKNTVKYFADNICGEQDLHFYPTTIFYTCSERLSLTALYSCRSEIINYIIVTYDEFGLNKYIEQPGYIFDNNATDYLIYEYFNYYNDDDEEKENQKLIQSEESFIGLIYVEYIKHLFSYNSYTMKNLPIYNISIDTPYSSISLTKSNIIRRDLYFINFKENKYTIRHGLTKFHEICNKQNISNGEISIVDYSEGDDSNDNSNNKYVLVKEIFFIGVILENPVKDITPYERAYLSSINRYVGDVNMRGGILDHFVHLEMYYYKDIISTFVDLKTTVFFGVLNYKYIEQYFLPLLYHTNKILVYLLPHYGEVCEKNILFMNYFPYEIGYHFTNFVVKKNRYITIIYNVEYSQYFTSLYPQLSNYPFIEIKSLSFDLNNRLTEKSITNLLKNNTDVILLLFGPVLHIDSVTFGWFIKLFNSDSNMIITDLCTFQIEPKDRYLIHNFYIISPYFDSLGNTSNTNLNYKYSSVSKEISIAYEHLFSDEYIFEYPQHMAITAMQLINRLFNDANSLEIDDHLWNIFNSNLKTISPYGLVYITVGRKPEQLLFIAQFKSYKKPKFIIEYSQETAIYPYNFNPYSSNKRCLLDIDVAAQDQYVFKILFILSPVEPTISINMFLTFYYQMNEINKEKIYNYRFQLFSKSYTTTEELKEIVQNNQDEYFAYVGFIFPYNLVKVRYDFNRTLLFHITGGTRQTLLQSNIISFSFVDTVAYDIVDDQFKKLLIKNVILIGLSKCPILDLFNKTMRNEYNLLDTIILDECGNAEEIMEESFRKYSTSHEKIAVIVIHFGEVCLRHIISAYENLELTSLRVTMHFVFPDYDAFLDFQTTLKHHYAIYSYMPYNSVTRSYNNMIKDNSFNQIHVNDFIYYSSLSMKLLSKGIDLYMDYKKEFVNIDKTLFRYLLYKNSFFNYGVKVSISTSNIIIHDHYYSQINNHLTLSVIETYLTSYRKDENDLPYYGPPILLFKAGKGIDEVIYLSVALNGVINLLFLAFIIIKRKSKIIRRAFPVFCVLVVISSVLLSVSSMYLSMIPESVGQCIGQIIFFLLSAILILSTLFIKLFKVHKVLNNTGIKKVKVTQCDLLYNILIITIVFTLYTIIWNFAVEPNDIYEEETGIEQTVVMKNCRFNIPLGVIAVIIFVIFYMMLLYSSFRLRNADPEFNESMSITYSAIVICVIIGPSSLYISDYSIRKVLIGMGISLVSTLISVIIMGEKIHLYYLNTRNAKDSGSKTTDSSGYSPYIHPKSNNIHSPRIELPQKNENPNNVVKSSKMIKLESVKSDEAKVCQTLLNRNLYVKDKLVADNLEGTLKVNDSGDLSQTDSNCSTSGFTKKNSKIYPKSGRSRGDSNANSIRSNKYLYKSEKHSLKMAISDYAPAGKDYESNSSKSSNKENSYSETKNLTVLSSRTALHEKTLIVTPSNEVTNVK